MADGKLTLYYGDTESYNDIGSGNYDSDGLYFIDGVIYRGENPYGGKIEQVTKLPDTGVFGVLYLLPDRSLYFWGGSNKKWQTVSVGMVSVIDNSELNDGKLVSQAAVKTYVDEKFGNISTDEATEKMVEAKVESAINEYKGEIDAKIASVFRFKGTKNSFSEVQNITEASVGDVWHVTADSKEYVYVDVTGDGNGEWELLGFTINLDAYATDQEVSDAINTAISDFYKKTEVYSKSEIDAIVERAGEDVSSHSTDNDIHVTPGQKENWSSHVTNNDIHVTSAQKSAWDAKASAQDITNAISEANGYTDLAITWNTITT